MFGTDTLTEAFAKWAFSLNIRKILDRNTGVFDRRASKNAHFANASERDLCKMAAFLKHENNLCVYLNRDNEGHEQSFVKLLIWKRTESPGSLRDGGNLVPHAFPYDYNTVAVGAHSAGLLGHSQCVPALDQAPGENGHS